MKIESIMSTDVMSVEKGDRLSRAAQIMKERDCGIVLGNPVLCTRNLARRLMPQLTSRTLDAVVGELGITIPDRHRALGDALATADVLVALLDRLQALGYHRIEHALQAQTAAGFRKLQQDRNAER